MSPTVLSTTRVHGSVMTRWSQIIAVFAATSAMLLTGVISAPTSVSASPAVYNSIITLGASGTYSVLSGASVANTVSAPGAPHTIVRGDLGVSSAGAISGFPPGEISGSKHSNDTHATDAQTALGAAYNQAFILTPTDEIGGDQAGMTLNAGVHHSAGAVSNTGLLILDGQGDSSSVFVFQVDAAVSIGAGTEIRLVNSAQASRVFWQVNGAVSVAAGAKIIGTFMAQNAISLGAGVVVDGRILARTGAVTMNNNFVDIAPPIGTTRFTPSFPVRLADTRLTTGWYSSLGAGKVLRIPVAGQMGVPGDVTAAALNVTAVEPQGTGFLTVYPCTAIPPTTSTVNFIVGFNVANSTIATLASDGHVCVYASVAVDVLVDITGWFTPGGSTSLTAVAPHRVADTRTGLGGSNRLTAGGVLVVATGELDAAGVALNVTAIDANVRGFLTVYPCGTPPNISTVNYAANDVRPNNTLVAVAAGGLVCVFASSAVDVLVDVTGVFSSSGEFDYLPATPIRLLDTRPNKVAADGQIQFVVPPANLPAGAVSVNVTATGHTVQGFVTAFNCGTAVPNVSTLNLRVGQGNANGVIVPVGAEMVGCLYTKQATNLIVDLNGWWVATAA